MIHSVETAWVFGRLLNADLIWLLVFDPVAVRASRPGNQARRHLGVLWAASPPVAGRGCCPTPLSRETRFRLPARLFRVVKIGRLGSLRKVSTVYLRRSLPKLRLAQGMTLSGTTPVLATLGMTPQEGPRGTIADAPRGANSPWLAWFGQCDNVAIT